MKVICDRGALLNAVNLMSGVVAARTPRPQLGCVLITAAKSGKAGSMTLAATDSEISLRLSTSMVEVEHPGQALIPADKLRQIVSAEENEPTLTIEIDKETCHIRGQDAHFQVYGYPPSDFVPIPDFASVVAGTGGQRKASAVFSHQAGALAGMISRTIFATARENGRYAINGVLFKRDDKRLEMVATDGRRLALSRGTISGDKAGGSAACIVPTKALSLLLKLIESPEEVVRVAVTDSQVLFSLGEGDHGRAVLISNLVEGSFPAYDEVIPKDQDKKVVFDREVLSSAVRRAALLTNEESRGVRMRFISGEKQLELTSRAPEMGEAQITVPLSGYEGEDIEIGFNPTFLTDALKVVADPQVIFELKAQGRPGLIRSGSDFVYVVMPVNLQ